MQGIVKTDVPIKAQEIQTTIKEASEELNNLKNMKFEPHCSKASCAICDVKEICKFKAEEA
jgi:hypothetical protein